MMTVIRTDDNAFRDFLFQQLGFLIGIVKQHIRSGLYKCTDTWRRPFTKLFYQDR